MTLIHDFLSVSPSDLAQVCRRLDINYLGAFGSRVRGNNQPDSDLDLLVDFNQPKSFFELAKAKFRLEKILGGQVDLVNKNNLKPILKPYIYQDLVTLYEG